MEFPPHPGVMAAVEPNHDSLAPAVRLLPGVAEELGWYVYALRDPLAQDEVFYVGKGRGDRLYAHVREALTADPHTGEDAEELKVGRIHRIHAAGREVKPEILRHGLETEALAYEAEAAVIDLFAMLGHPLTNKARGKHSRAHGWIPFDDLITAYAAREVEFTDPLMLIRPTRQWYPGISADDLYRATRKAWVVDLNRARKATYVCSVANGIIRAVYKAERWLDAPGEEPRRIFDGAINLVGEGKYLRARVGHLLPNGAQNPIRYVGC
jgi:hypothetical protein